MKKRFYVILAFICFSVAAASTQKPLDFTVAFEPTLLVNTGNKDYSAPSPFVFPFSLGIVVPNKTLFSFQPRLSFFTNYYLWAEDAAYPAEIENRTATAFWFLVDLPACATLKLAERHGFEFAAGPSVATRFGILSSGVESSDPGYNGTAKDDVSEINSWFWKDANFLYLYTGVSYLYTFSDVVKAGPELSVRFPLGSIFSGNGMNAALISLGAKARF